MKSSCRMLSCGVTERKSICNSTSPIVLCTTGLFLSGSRRFDLNNWAIRDLRTPIYARDIMFAKTRLHNLRLRFPVYLMSLFLKRFF